MDNFKVDNVSEIIRLAAKDADYSTMILISQVDKIRKEKGHYIFAYPIKWRDENNKTYKETFAWSIEFESGKCVDYGMGGEPEILSYQDALIAAVEYIKNHSDVS